MCLLMICTDFLQVFSHDLTYISGPRLTPLVYMCFGVCPGLKRADLVTVTDSMCSYLTGGIQYNYEAHS